MVSTVYNVTGYSICSVRIQYLSEGGPNVKDYNRIFDHYSKFTSIAGQFYRIVRIFASSEDYKSYAILKVSDDGKLYFKSCAACRFFIAARWNKFQKTLRKQDQSCETLGPEAEYSFSCLD